VVRRGTLRCLASSRVSSLSDVTHGDDRQAGERNRHAERQTDRWTSRHTHSAGVAYYLAARRRSIAASHRLTILYDDAARTPEITGRHAGVTLKCLPHEKSPWGDIIPWSLYKGQYER